MTNETTASQPKSIGDDAQFLTLLSRYRTAADTGCFDNKNAARALLVKLIDSHAQASAEEFRVIAAEASAKVLVLKRQLRKVQASATIQAAPDADELHFNAQRMRNVAALVGVPADGDDAHVDGVRGALLGLIAAKLRRAATIQEPVMVAEPVAWRIGMIVHHDKAKAELDSIHWNVPLEPLYLAAPIVSQQVESKPLYLVKFDGTEAWKEASEDAYWTFSERNRKIVYELAAPIVAEPVSHELMQQLGTMRAVGAAPMVADPADLAALELSDEGIVKVLASFGIDSTESKYGFDALQVATTVPSIRRVVETYLAATVKAVPSEALDDAATKLCGKLLCLPQVDTGKGIYVSAILVNRHVKEFMDAAPLADKTGGGE